LRDYGVKNAEIGAKSGGVLLKRAFTLRRIAAE
jgi:hypothetical protein